MTRINLVDPSTLHSKHLLAEYRELPRVFRLVKAVQDRGLTPDTISIPAQYILGPGHVTFFYDKLEFLEDRFHCLVRECLRRGFNIVHMQVPDLGIKAIGWWNDYTPTPEAIALNLARIQERVPKSAGSSL